MDGYACMPRAAWDTVQDTFIAWNTKLLIGVPYTMRAVVQSASANQGGLDEEWKASKRKCAMGCPETARRRMPLHCPTAAANGGR
jgi:hypothetical protein